VVPDAVVRRFLRVHQVVLAGPFEVRVRGGEPGAVPVDRHLHGAVVPLAQVVAGAPEVGHGEPAGPHAARAADAVALALQGHVALHRLARGQEVRRATATIKLLPPH